MQSLNIKKEAISATRALFKYPPLCKKWPSRQLSIINKIIALDCYVEDLSDNNEIDDIESRISAALLELGSCIAPELSDEEKRRAANRSVVEMQKIINVQASLITKSCTGAIQ